MRRLILVSWAFLLVIFSGLLHAVWNVLAKRSDNPAVFLWWFQWIAVLVFLPWAVASVSSHPIPLLGWLLLAATVMLHGGYVLLLSQSYRYGDLSQVYPLMRGMGPLLVPLMGVSFLGEHLTRLGWSGVIGIVAGISLLGRWHWRGIRPSSGLSRTSVLAVCVGLSITAYTVMDKVTLRYLPAVSLNDATNLGNLLALSWWALRSGAIRTEWMQRWPSIVLAGVMSSGAYWLFLMALRMAPVAQMAPLRAIGTVFATVLGITVLKESQGGRRLAAAGLITAGVLLLGMWGT